MKTQTRAELREALERALRGGGGAGTAIEAALAYLKAEQEAGVPELTHLVTLRKKDCASPLLVPADRVADFAKAGWHPVEEGDW